MNYKSVAGTAKSWNVSERTVRNYCATGKIPGAILIGKTWNIPQDAERPERVNKKQPAPRTLLNILQDEMAGHVKGGIYHKIHHPVYAMAMIQIVVIFLLKLLAGIGIKDIFSQNRS